MPPVEFYFTKENHIKIGTGQSARISFLNEKGEKICLVDIKGKENGGEVTVRKNKNGQTEENHFTIETGQVNKEHLLCNKTPIVVIGTSN